eukprot:TRINITY_DN15396_c0_g1_i2.p1 TRINITY_DN15396_c0_g1~~TRINITY_DN15396_c0_g1_i2.p1  ORF type:complete len:311 (+),score=-30.85 TRINITY_DN15396_c0_g1_i2:128-934(+)
MSRRKPPKPKQVTLIKKSYPQTIATSFLLLKNQLFQILIIHLIQSNLLFTFNIIKHYYTIKKSPTINITQSTPIRYFNKKKYTNQLVKNIYQLLFVNLIKKLALSKQARNRQLRKIPQYLVKLNDVIQKKNTQTKFKPYKFLVILQNSKNLFYQVKMNLKFYYSCFSNLPIQNFNIMELILFPKNFMILETQKSQTIININNMLPCMLHYLQYIIVVAISFCCSFLISILTKFYNYIAIIFIKLTPKKCYNFVNLKQDEITPTFSSKI